MGIYLEWVGFSLRSCSVGIIVGGIVGVFIGGAWLHIFVWLLRGRKGYDQTVKSPRVRIDTGTPDQRRIPIIGIIGALWTSRS